MEIKELEIYKDKMAGRIILNRSKAYNALSFSMIQKIYKSLLNFEEDQNIKLIIISSNSEKAFCAGGDVKWLYALNKNEDAKETCNKVENKIAKKLYSQQFDFPRGASRESSGVYVVVNEDAKETCNKAEDKIAKSMEFFMQEYRLNAYIPKLKKPYISIMNGLTMGGGVGIGLHGSHPVATESFVFAMPETAIGLFPDVGASYLLSRLPNGIGMYLALTGKTINAFTAYKLGLVKYVIKDVDIQSCIQKLTNSSSDDIDYCLGSFHVNTEMEFLPVDYIKECFTQTSLEEIIKALKKLNNEWAQQILQTLQAYSPMSLKVTFLQIQKAKHKNLESCLKMDKQLVKHFVQGHDFYEGIRAMLIDKDKTPHWRPKTLDEVTDFDLNNYFHG